MAGGPTYSLDQLRVLSLSASVSWGAPKDSPGGTGVGDERLESNSAPGSVMKQEYLTAKDLAAKELREALASTEALLTALGDEESESVNELRARLTATIADIREQLGNSFLATARYRYHQARETAATVNRFTHRHPWSAVVIGVGVGVLIGRLVAD